MSGIWLKSCNVIDSVLVLVAACFPVLMIRIVNWPEREACYSICLVRQNCPYVMKAYRESARYNFTNLSRGESQPHAPAALHPEEIAFGTDLSLGGSQSQFDALRNN